MTVGDAMDNDAMADEPSNEELGPAMELLPPDPGTRDEQFAKRVRRAIHRRLLGSSIVEFCLVAPLVVLLELATIIDYLFRDAPDERRPR